MRYLRLVIVAALLMCSVSAFASCPDRQDLFSSSFFFFDATCGSRTGNVSTSTQSCQSRGADQFNYFSGQTVYSMTVPSDLSGSPWVAWVYVDFNDPNTYYMNGISATVSVENNGNVSHTETIFIHNGNNGSLSCQQYYSSSFSASPGDTIKVTYTGVNYTSATMKIAAPYISFN